MAEDEEARWMLQVSDVSDLLKPGIYLLSWRGEVVYIGRARCLLTLVAAHRAILSGRPDPILPRVQFDGIKVIACASDRADELFPALIDLYQPRHNLRHTAPTNVIMDDTVTLSDAWDCLQPQPPPRR